MHASRTCVPIAPLTSVARSHVCWELTQKICVSALHVAHSLKHHDHHEPFITLGGDLEISLKSFSTVTSQSSSKNSLTTAQAEALTVLILSWKEAEHQKGCDPSWWSIHVTFRFERNDHDLRII